MKIFQSSFTARVLQQIHERLPEKQPNVLLSYGIRKNDDLLIMQRMRNYVSSLILDSGTFSLHTSDGTSEEEITFQGYSNYLDLCHDKYNFYFNFDRNFTTAGFEENQCYLKQLEAKGFNPIPVVHDYYRDEIDIYIEEGYQLVALGSVMEPGTVKFLRKKTDIDHAVERLIKHNIKIHVFAAASYNQLFDIPVYSSDASSWAQHAANGRILYWNEENDSDDKTDFIRFFDRPGLKEDGNYFFNEYPHRRVFEEHLDSLGITYEDLIGKDMHLFRQVVNAAYYIQLEEIITQKHKEQGFPF
jgi:hypothetical protein